MFNINKSTKKFLKGLDSLVLLLLLTPPTVYIVIRLAISNLEDHDKLMDKLDTILTALESLNKELK